MSPTLPLSGRDIVCFASDWNGDPLSKKHIMTRLALDNRILWVNSLGNRAPAASARDMRRLLAKARAFLDGLKEVQTNVFMLSPLAVPAYGRPGIAAINRAALGAQVRSAMRQLHFWRPITYTFVPASAWIAGRLREDLLVYHVTDEYSAFAGAGEAIAALDADLCRRADLVIACSQPLLEKKRPLSRHAILVRHGVEHAHFASALEADTPVAPEIADLPHPVIGFHGLIAEWVDLDLVRDVADAFPQGSVALVGDVTRDDTSLRGARNIRLIGRQPYERLPSFCKGFDVALLPFVLGPLTEAANPLKLREYLAAGLPVVATAITEARMLEGRGVTVADPALGPAGFIEAVRTALELPGPRIERSHGVANETWDGKVLEIASAIARLRAPPVHAPQAA